ncbi:MAG TPA: M15 family metallopeptidase [Kofleriaceae bacterium]|nr:M15 family metallopeptidase [Kofleriaceae bacterium]
MSWLRSILAVALAVGCGSRTPRTTTEDRHVVTAAPAPPADASVRAEPIVEPPPPPPPAPKLAWLNPARCALPCAYDPQAELVRVDDQGAASPAGAHLVHRTIEEPLRALVAAARGAGHKIRIESAFRSYDYQAKLFATTKQRGRAARPGHSEHQLGTAVDFRMPTSAAIAWLAAHAAEHGFALSYPDGKQRVTGYRPEPWHVRYVGRELADELRTSGSTLEELFRARADLGESGGCDDCALPVSQTSCGAVTDAGRCDGSVLEWCYDGALATVDCAASKQRCGRAKGAPSYDCLAR